MSEDINKAEKLSRLYYANLSSLAEKIDLVSVKKLDIL